VDNIVAIEARHGLVLTRVAISVVYCRRSGTKLGDEALLSAAEVSS